MGYKTYKINSHSSGYTMRLAGTKKFITFLSIGRGSAYDTGKPQYATSDVAIQKAIEESPLFLENVIELEKTVETEKEKVNTGDENTGGDEKTVYEDITTVQQAKDILRGEPYNIVSQALTDVKRIKNKAEELNLLFPNVKWE